MRGNLAEEYTEEETTEERRERLFADFYGEEAPAADAA